MIRARHLCKFQGAGGKTNAKLEKMVGNANQVAHFGMVLFNSGLASVHGWFAELFLKHLGFPIHGLWS